jgi:hypothetical protein
LAKETSVPQVWIAERLNLKSAANASQQIRRFHLVPEQEQPKEVKGHGNGQEMLPTPFPAIPVGPRRGT